MCGIRALGLITALVLLVACGTEQDPAVQAGNHDAQTALSLTDSLQDAVMLGLTVGGDTTFNPAAGNQSDAGGHLDCVHVEWSRPERAATATFDACQLGGRLVDGTVALRAGSTPHPWVTTTFTDLRIDDRVVSGDVTASWTGSAAMTVTAALIYVSGDRSLTLESATVWADTTGLVVDTQGHFADAEQDADFVATGLTWMFGDCLPTQGSVSLSKAGEPPSTVTFLPTTPETGEVEVQHGSLPPVPYAISPVTTDALGCSIDTDEL